MIVTRFHLFESWNDFSDGSIIQEIAIDSSKQVKLGSISGLVPREKSMAFERILFRATRGNVFLRQSAVDEPVTDPVSGEKVSAHNLLARIVHGNI